ncbi:MAG: copper oxidase [Acidobacteria bacterium]|nr:copper oxidase [Acidobacteriota bacterium]
MNHNRRSFLAGLAGLAGAATASRVAAQQHVHPLGAPTKPVVLPDPPPTGISGVVPVLTPDVPHLPFEMDGHIKVFRLRAEPVATEFLPGRKVDVWGFNGSMPGPTIEANEGDRVRIIVENHLPELFAPHWHGLEIPIGQDGVPGISQPPIPPHGSHTYEFTLNQNGTFFYHSHMPMQEMLGSIGFFIVHPKKPHEPRVDRDFGLIFQGWDIKPNNTVPNTLAMEFNWLTINGKAGPATTPLCVKRGERVRIRIVNLSMDHHPVHLHGHHFFLTGTEAGRVRGPVVVPENTIIAGVAQARDIEFVANNPGDWMLHCHLPHHMMNQMVSMVGPSGAADTATGHQHGGAADAYKVKGFPQDMWMVMDELVAGKPEVHGLAPGWTAAMMGMMTLVRVLEPEMFDHIQQLRAEAAR